MKIKIKNFQTIYITDYNYFVRFSDGKILLVSKDRNCIAKSSSSEELELPKGSHVQLLLRNTEIRVYPKGKLIILNQ